MYAAVSTSGSRWTVWVGTGLDDPAACQTEVASAHGRPRLLLAGLHALLQARGAQLADLAGFALDVGPGSFTGLRSGMAAVRALAWAAGVPVCAVPAWHAMAHRADPSANAGVLCALRARTGMWYLARWPQDAIQQVATDGATQWLADHARPGDLLAGTAWTDPDLAATAVAALVGLPQCRPFDGEARSVAAVALTGPPQNWQSAVAALPTYVSVSEAENREIAATLPPCGGLPERAQ